MVEEGFGNGRGIPGVLEGCEYKSGPDLLLIKQFEKLGDVYYSLRDFGHLG
jgi:hypothetical protein